MSMLVPVDLKNILLNENAYFYRTKKNITKSDIIRLFTEALADKKNAKRKYKTRIRESLSNGPKVIAKYSLEIFEFQTKPIFLKEPEDGKWETKFGFFLILEYGEYVAIVRKNVSGIFSTLNALMEAIDYDVLAYFLTTPKSKFEKIVSENMNTAENAVQVKQSEGRDLKGTTSRFGASKQIPTAMRLDNAGVKNGISLKTSRVNSFQLRTEFQNNLFWMVEMMDKIDIATKKLPANAFLDGFADSVDYSKVIGTLEPTYLLLRFSALKNDMEVGGIARCFTRDPTDGSETSFNLLSFLNSFEHLFKLTRESHNVYSDGDLKVRVNAYSITVSHKQFKEIILEYPDGDSETFIEYINGGKHFIVNFNKLEYVYTLGKIFKDSKLLGDIDAFMETFLPYPELITVKTEKGSGYTTASTRFNPDCLFGFIEDKFGPAAECLICDDMGAEWGDFISVEKNSITFYHAKANKGGLSASKLEEVFGQAQKNFGSLEMTEDMINYRATRWQKKYSINAIQTNIPRIRKCSSTTNQIDAIKDLVYHVSSNANVRRRVFIVINFLSKSEVEKYMNELKKGNSFAKAGVALQILWFVNSLLCSAHELGAEIRIICKP